MGFLGAAVLLAWIVLILLAFGFAAVLRQLRDIQAELRSRPAPAANPKAPQQVRPSGAAELAVILLTDASCPVCEELAPTYLDLIATAPDDLDFVVLSTAPSQTWLAAVENSRLRLVQDAESFHRLDPGWRPALVLVDREATIIAGEPIGSASSLRTAVELFVGKRLAEAPRRDAVHIDS